MTKQKTVICGAGIIGVASAYYLSLAQPDSEIILIDKLTPLSFTTGQSGENFREYWPQTCLNQFCGRSIDLMEKLAQAHDDVFTMKFSGYDFVSHQENHHIFPVDASTLSENFDILSSPNQIAQQKPYLATDIKQVMHLNRAGAIDVYMLGSLLLNQAKRRGVKVLMEEITGLSDHDSSYEVVTNAQIISADQLIIAAGPFSGKLAKMLGVELPIYNVKQGKFVFTDTQAIIPRDIPFTIYADEQYLNWNEEDTAMISEDPEFAHLLEKHPAGLHIKPEGADQIKLGWAFNRAVETPQWELSNDSSFADIVMRGASRFIPALSCYVDDIPKPIHHFSGYYTRTEENLPLIGEIKNGCYVATALAGYGTMAACATGELISQIINQNPLPVYAEALSPDRYSNPELMASIAQFSGDGQL